MKNTKNTIVINGRIYDSRTGRPISNVQRKQIAVSDMIVKPLPQAVKLPVTPATKPSAAPKPKKAHPSHTPHATQKTTKRALQHSQTLMRSAVKKPHTKQVHVTQPVEAPAATIQVSRRALASPKQANHQERAQTVQKSHLISKFGSPVSMPKSFTKRTAPVAVAPAPAREPHVPAVPPPAPSQSEVLFTRALREATAHTQPAHSKHRAKTRSRSFRRMARSSIAGALTIAVVFVASAAFMLNQQERSDFRQAAQSAGIVATLPTKVPSGYGRPVVQSAPGEVILRYNSNSDGRSFSISQQAEVASGGEATLGADSTSSTIDAGNGTTIYRSNNLATWTHNGLRYTVSNATNLSNDQLRALASDQ